MIPAADWIIRKEPTLVWIPLRRILWPNWRWLFRFETCGRCGWMRKQHLLRLFCPTPKFGTFAHLPKHLRLPPPPL